MEQKKESFQNMVDLSNQTSFRVLAYAPLTLDP